MIFSKFVMKVPVAYKPCQSAAMLIDMADHVSLFCTLLVFLIKLVDLLFFLLPGQLIYILLVVSASFSLSFPVIIRLNIEKAKKTW